ncbi:MAG TPA: FUSC family protein [Roseiarcus sp.]|nr:FUSC family protein [Roseiarcus sp.]
MNRWTRSPKLLKLFVGQHVANGLGVAAGVMIVALTATAWLGFLAGFAFTLGAIAASIGDFPAPLRDKAKSMSAGFALALIATTLALAAARWPALEIATIGLVSFAGGLITGYGRWAIATSMQILIAMVLGLGYPPMDFSGVLKISASMGVGGAGYIAISLVISRAIAASDRRMMTSESLREFAAYLFVYARFADPETDLAAVYGRVIRHQAALSEQLQSARALLLEKPRATKERVRLAASIGVILDALDALVAAQCDLPDLRRLPAAAEWMRRIAILVRATALDVQHLSLDLIAHREPALPRDHQLARDSSTREGLRLAADEDTPADVRAAIGRTLARFDAARDAIARLERALGDDAAAEAAIGEIRLSAFRAARSFHPRALKPHLTLASPVFRYALRLALAMMAGGLVAAELGGERHGNWVLLTISVILRGGYGLTRQRRNDRVIGTLIGCVIASAAVAYSPPWGLLAMQAVGLAVAHGFARLNYRVASTGASMMALVSLHLAEPNFPSPMLARLTDTLIGAAIAHLFSYVLPNWEISEAPKIAGRLKGRAAGLADVALSPGARDQDYRLARKDFMEALAALSDSAARMGGDPRAARRGLDEMSAMVIAASRAAAQISAARLDAIAARAIGALEAERRIAREALAGATAAPNSRLAATLADFVAAADAYEKAARREADLREA